MPKQIALFVEKATDEKYEVKGYHNFPEQLPEHVLANMIMVDSVLEVEYIEGKEGKLYINPKTLEQWIEYADRELTEMEKLKKENDELKNSLADLWEVVLLGGE